MNEDEIEKIISDAENENDSSDDITLSSDELKDIVKDAIKDALQEIEEEKALEQYELETKGLIEEEPVPHVIIDSIESVPDVNINNFDEQNEESIDYSTITDAIYSLKDEPVVFGEDTDSRLYSTEGSVASSTASQQTVEYMLECRNILLIFTLAWFSVYIIKMIHRTVMRFTKGRKED